MEQWMCALSFLCPIVCADLSLVCSRTFWRQAHPISKIQSDLRAELEVQIKGREHQSKRL